MRIGLCGPISQIDEIAKIGFDYIEPTVVSVVQMDSTEYKEALKKAKEAGIGCEVFNVLFPGDIRLIGPETDLYKVEEYLKGALDRIAGLGAQVVVFGSGGARKIPADLTLGDGWNELVEVARLMGKLARQYDIVVAVEPLNKRETNIITSLAQGIKFVDDVGHPNIKLLADFYHMRMEGEPMEAIRQTTADILVHGHIANGQGRTIPLDKYEDVYRDFFLSLNSIGYRGRVSIEASTKDIKKEGPIALDLLRTLLP
ncbi:MAG: sugar phosphate isomerase/epimerase family protein [Caldicoprobacterales bacterium]|jgi:D-psicose/D-tagatose/L-ribulose 3-epimerase|nr:sugar phosphate isomerase/epimerase [Clostridiales bacterium]